jgi:CXXC-20-CXXC protein
MGAVMKNEDRTTKICLNCGHQFTYREKFQSTWRLFWRMKCKECGARYGVLVRYRLLFGLLWALPVAIGPSLIAFYQWNAPGVFFAEGVYFASMLALTLLAVPLMPLKLDPENK